METKKNPNVDIFQYSNIIFQLCLITIMGLTLMAFEWRKPENNLIDFTEVSILKNDSEVDKMEEIMYNLSLDVD
ncbi:MAG: hypothetical protein EAZ85_01855 [Bacteroidetes bacterium]|nr:MAG: hypothetical protein EAZ85_01855 [Bacteroidota bacterium]TAG90385.1 MAG: hypothetical protein EAZ20_04455 [Bacteroidota bacterium]